MLLFDTCLLLWAAYEPQRLSSRAAALLKSRETPAVFSLATIWEVAVKTSIGRSDFSVDPGVLHRALLAEGFAELPIHARHLFRVAALPWIHRDPFDRVLVAQAMEDGLTLVTGDATLKRYGRFVRAV